MRNLSDREVAAGYRAAIESGHAAGKRRSWRKVTTIVDNFGGARLNEDLRARIVAAFDEAGVVTEPSMSVAERGDSVRLSMRDTPSTVTSDPAAVCTGLKVTLWSETAVRQAGLADVRPGVGEIALIDINPADLAEDSAAVRELREHLTPAPAEEQLRDLAIGDELPRFTRQDSWVHISTVRVDADDSAPGDANDSVTTSSAGRLFLRPVEFLVGPDWLLVAQPPDATGSELPGGDGDLADVLRLIEEDWLRDDHPRSPGMLALLIVHRLANDYAEACRAMSSWLEQWDLKFTRATENGAHVEVRTLADIRTAMTRFRKAVVSLNSVLKQAEDAHVGPAELLGSTRALVDQALDQLMELNDNLRGALQLVSLRDVNRQLHIAQQTQAEAQRATEASSHTRELFEFLAAFLAGPTLIIGLFGANTWLPGQGTITGFGLMLLISAVAGALAWLLITGKRRAAQKHAAQARHSGPVEGAAEQLQPGSDRDAHTTGISNKPMELALPG